MNEMNIAQVSDSEFIKEYVRRFRIQNYGTISNSDEALLHLKTFITEHDREHFICIFLNNRCEVVKTEVLFTGTITQAAVYPREFAKAILNNKASSVIIAHNHPSGSLKPSVEDMNITKKLNGICELLEVTLHDHLIITADSYYSFADNGLM